MCLVIGVALAATAYLAVYFNRRAKADLDAALTPLAQEISGSVQLDDAQVVGSFQGDPVYARMANASEGPGRVFQVELIDSAGGTLWHYTSTPSSPPGSEPTVEFAGEDALRDRIQPLIATRAQEFLKPAEERFRIEYLNEQGCVRLVRTMRTRRDIPDTETFVRELEVLSEIAAENRSVVEQFAESAPSHSSPDPS